MERHYGMDWLRIGAFGLLIFYHIGMVFVPWGFHVKTAQPMDRVVIPMLATNSWRLLLLFVVSGFASRALLAKGGGVYRFVASRTTRLLLPLLFGIVVIVPVQPWVELVTQHGYTGNFLPFLLHDYFHFGAIAGIVLPTWNHLWFVFYLWAYTLVLAALVALIGQISLQAAFDTVFGNVLVWLLPAAWLILVAAWLFPGVAPTNAFFGDWVSHIQYLPGFLFGFALAGSRPTMVAIRRWWQPAAATALLSYLAVAAIEWRWPGSAMPSWPYGLIFAGARSLQGWSTIIALVGLADRYLNHDHPWRATLTEAVFPFYLIHQTIIVLVEFLLLPLALSPVVEFGILALATVAGCWIFYLAGREIRWLRPLIGLRRRSSSSFLQERVA